MKSTYLLLIWIFMAGLIPHIGSAQIVKKYKEDINGEHYAFCIEAENSISDTNSLNAGKIYLNLGRKSGVYSEYLGIEYESQAINIFRKHQADSLIAVANISISIPKINIAKYEEAEEHLQSTIAYALQINNDKLRFRAYSQFGYLESARGNYEQALDYFLQCYDFFIKYIPLSGLPGILNKIGMTYSNLGDCNTALKYFNKYLHLDLDVYENIKIFGHGSLAYNAAMCELELGNTARAKILLQRNIIIRKSSNSSKLISNGYYTMCEVAIIDKDLNLAQRFLDTAFIFANKFNSLRVLSSLNNKQAEIYAKQNPKSPKVQDKYEKARNFALQSRSSDSELTAIEGLVKYYSSINAYKKAFSYSQLADSIKEELFSTEVIAGVKKIENDLSKKLNKEKLKRLELEKNISEQATLKERKAKYSFIALMVLLGITSILLYYLLVLRSNNNKILSSKNKEIQSALDTNKVLVKEIHHRVKNNLQIVSSLLGLQSRFNTDEKSNDAIITGKSRVQAMALLHQNLYQNEDLKSISIQKYFTDLCSNLISTYKGKENNISIENQVEPLTLDLDLVVTLGLITNEIVTNSIKHAFINQKGGLINIKINADGAFLNFEISDNGIGLKDPILPSSSSTLGFELIRSFIKKLKAELEIDNQHGTHYKLRIPIGDELFELS